MHIYEQFPIIIKNGHLLNSFFFIEIQIGSNLSHIIIRIQFLIQPPSTHTIHHAQGLTFDHLTFDIIGATKNGLTYTT